MLAEGGSSIDARIGYAFERAVQRQPSAEERRTLQRLYQQSAARFNGSPKLGREFIEVGEDPVPVGVASAELAAMTAVTRAVLNMHETITRN